jgi:hypothetical protein
MNEGGQKFLVFAGGHRTVAPTLAEAAVIAKRLATGVRQEPTVFDFTSGELIELDLRGTFAHIQARYAKPKPKGRGRPKLGVTAREVTLLPRHWDWLARQPGGASATLRRIIDMARKAGETSERKVEARDAAYRLMVTLGGNRAGFEEAARSLFRGDEGGLLKHMQSWPPDIRLSVLERLRAEIGDEG